MFVMETRPKLVAHVSAALGELSPDCKWRMTVVVHGDVKGNRGSEGTPAEVFGVIETALRAHFARAIEP